ncbi:MAG: alpha-galactosidase, partial [Planctomycetes bacterium]|nr:alpha-galactosidase [Planctomycetota bacterium]
MRNSALVLLLLVFVSYALGDTPVGVRVPSQRPGEARAENIGGQLRLANDVISMSWSTAGGKLQPLSITDRLHGKTWQQTGCDMFHIATGAEPAEVAYDDLHIGMRIRARMIDVMVSRDGKSWRSVYQHEVSDRAKLPAVVRVGKMDMQGGLTDCGDRGKDGLCRFSDFRIHGDQGVILSAEDFQAELDRDIWRTHLSTKQGTAATISDGRLQIATGGNCATCIERALPEPTRFVSCRVVKETDSGMSWGPGIALVWEDGEFVVCGIRDASQVNVHTKDGERFLGVKRFNPSRLDLSASRFTIVGGPQIVDVSETQGGSGRTGKSIRVTLLDKESGIAVDWRGILWDGAHYIRQEFSLTAAPDDVPISGLELLHCRIGEAAQRGSVLGSPVATSGMFAGVELPVGANSVGGTGDLRCGFGCKLKLTAGRPYEFSSVLGVYAAGQLRRSFLSYIEAERARPSRPFMHYNCWYDLGYHINAAGIVDAATQFQEHLAKPFGLKIEAYVLDDGWDDFHRGLWVTNLDRFPGGFEALSKELAKRDSSMGIWISPMGGYGGDKLRTALA